MEAVSPQPSKMLQNGLVNAAFSSSKAPIISSVCCQHGCQKNKNKNKRKKKSLYP